MLHPIGRWGDDIQHALRLCSSTSTEWITDPLSRSPELEHFASFDTNDAMYGALYDPCAFKWHGSGHLIPTSQAPEASYRALKWALMSTFDSQPALNVGLILYDPSHGGIARLMNHRNAHLLCTFSKGALPLRQPDAWHDVRSHLHTNKARFALVTVSNITGEQVYYHPTQIAARMTALERQGIKPEDWSVNITRQQGVNEEDVHTKGYDRAGTAEPTVQLNHINTPVTQGRLPSEWWPAIERYCTQPAKRFLSPSSIVFTDGSKLNDSLTGAVHQASTGLTHSFKI